MSLHWRHSVFALAATAAVFGLVGCEGCEPEPQPQVGCALYCSQMMDACDAASGGYADEAACLAACEGFPTNGADGDASGDTLQCRTFHAGAAAEDATHCAHASASGGDVCGSNCDVYCRFMVGTCAGFDDVPTCLSTCASYPADGALNAADGNTVQCRTYHAMAAQSDDTHCEHASITGGGVCGDDACEAYCDQVMNNCQAAQAVYPNRDACLAGCANIPADGAWDATDGNSVQCRAYHGAGAAAGDPAGHCGHASANGGGVCGEYCDAYCNQVMANCTDGNSLYASDTECSTACGAFPEGSDFAVGGNSVQCRIMHGSYPSAEDPAAHCGHAAAVSAGDVCADPVAPPTTITVSGAVHEMGGHFANNHVGVQAANILAYGVSGNISALTGANGAYSLANVPANGQVILFANKNGYQPTYTAVPVGSTDLNQSLLLAEAAWVNSLNTTYGVTPGTAFTCQFDASLQCVYSLMVGQILDDGSNDPTGAGQPVAGVSATDFTITGGDDNVAWRHMGPYFLNANGTVGANSTSQSAGLYAVYVEIPQIAAGYDSVHIEFAIQVGTGDTARYFGPTHSAAYRGASTAVTWVNIAETGIVPGGGGGAIDFGSQIYPLFLPTAQGGYGCQGCHTNQNGASPAGGLNLYGGADVAYAQLEPTAHPTRVNLADPAASALLTEPLYESTGVQNHPIFAFVSTQDPGYQLILQWITEGALQYSPSARVSFVAQIRPMLGNATGDGGIGCVSCHAGGAGAGLQLDGTAGEMYNELVVEAAQDGSGANEDYRVNKTGYPERSLLLTNPLAGNTEAHPQKPFASAADPRYQVLFRWIQEGYNNDGYCEDYCTGILAACTGTNEQYNADHQACLDACGAMPRGEDTDTEGDTLGCRNYHLGAAEGDPAGHCDHAGPGGGGVCGTVETTLCRQITQICTGTNEQFDSQGQCVSLMKNITAGTIGDTDTASAWCRSYHVQAAQADAAGHCAHTGPSGGPDACGDWCDFYCQSILSICVPGTANEQYADDAACQAACGGFATTGTMGDADGNTLQCRLYHLGVAAGSATDATAHCPHAGQASTGVCD